VHKDEYEKAVCDAAPAAAPMETGAAAAAAASASAGEKRSRGPGDDDAPPAKKVAAEGGEAIEGEPEATPSSPPAAALLGPRAMKMSPVSHRADPQGNERVVIGHAGAVKLGFKCDFKKRCLELEEVLYYDE
jgi:hypothetical protein